MNKKCQVFTPQNYVEKLLDSVGYKKNLQGKRVLENSCGDGNILSVVVQRYIDDCKNEGMSLTQIRDGLQNDIYGIEIDPVLVKKCIKRMDEVAKKNGVKAVSWNIVCKDYLKSKDAVKYDFIVGNPPYITYSEMEEETRVFLKRDFLSCKKGKYDYCYAFIEKGINSLSSTGRMAYVVPSSIYKTVFGEKLREIMLPHVESVIDFTQEKVFDSALVKSSIVVLKQENTEQFSYSDMSNGITRSMLKCKIGKKWVFNDCIQTNKKKRFGDYFKVSHSVATLLNSVYVLSDASLNDRGNYVVDGYEIERALIRETATPRSFRTGATELILFPYSYDNNHELIRYTDKTFKELYPMGYSYMYAHKDVLAKRKADKKARWFEYGRSQALSSLDQEKCLISTVVSSTIHVYHLKRECIPYAGMYIIPKDNNTEISLARGAEILRSDAFKEYLLEVGIHINGNSVRITSKDIENYSF